MREIKFRAYIFDLTDKNSHPLEIDPHSGKVWDVASINFNDRIIEIWDDEGDTWEYELNNEIALMQYVGAKDKNGIEIYEGDIIRHCRKKDGTDYVIMWSDASFGFIAEPIKEKPWHPHLNPGTMISYEVIGNIYENPNLESE